MSVLSKNDRSRNSFASAFATTPAPPRLDDVLKSIKITSLHDFDSSHLAGTYLNNFFDRLQYGSPDSFADMQSLYTSNQPRDLRLEQKPLMDSVQQFIIQVEFEKAGILTDTADAVTFR